MAQRDEIVRYLDETLEADQYRDHLPLGLQVPGAAEVTHVCTAVSASLDVFERAAADGAQMLIVHHGLFWDGSPRRIGMLERRRLETLIAALTARGVRVVTHDDAPIHVSGHARADEIAAVLGLLQPRHVVPLHGERSMQEAQARIAVARCGLERGRVPLAENGDVLGLVNGHFEVVERVAARVIEADADGWPLSDS